MGGSRSKAMRQSSAGSMIRISTSSCHEVDSMPRTRSLAWSELKIGLLTLLAVAIAMFLIFTLSGEGGFSWQQYGLKAMFPSVPGLKPGAPVRVAGVEVGSVSEVEFAGDKVE